MLFTQVSVIASASLLLSTKALYGLLVFVAALCLVILLLLIPRDGAHDESVLAPDASISLSALRGYALALVDAQRFELAEQALEQYLLLLPGDAHLRALRGALLAERGDHIGALMAFEHVSAILRRKHMSPSRAISSYGALICMALADEMQALGRMEEAQSQRAEAQRLKSSAYNTTVETHILQLVKETSRDTVRERLAFEQLTEWEHGRPHPTPFGFSEADTAVRFYRAACAEYPDNGRLLADYAQALHAASDHEKAEQLFAQALRLQPHDTWMLYDLAMLLWRFGRLEEATQCLAQATRLSPETAAIRGTLGLLLFKQGQTEQAEHEFVAALGLRPDVWILARLYGSLLLAQGNVESATQMYHEAERLGANDLAFRLDYAEVLLRRNESSRAEEQYRHGIRSEGRSGVARTRYGIFLITQARFDEAEQYLREAILWPQNVEAQLALAHVYIIERRLEEAHTHLRHALEEAPNAFEAKELYAQWLALRGKTAEALSITQTLINQGYANGTLWLTHSQALLTMNRQMEAQVALREATRVDPKFPMTLLQQARALRTLGRFDAASETLEQVNALAPNWPEAVAEYNALMLEQPSRPTPNRR